MRRFSRANLGVKRIHAAGVDPDQSLIFRESWATEVYLTKQSTWLLNEPNLLFDHNPTMMIAPYAAPSSVRRQHDNRRVVKLLRTCGPVGDRSAKQSADLLCRGAFRQRPAVV